MDDEIRIRAARGRFFLRHQFQILWELGWAGGWRQTSCRQLPRRRIDDGRQRRRRRWRYCFVAYQDWQRCQESGLPAFRWHGGKRTGKETKTWNTLLQTCLLSVNSCLQCYTMFASWRLWKQPWHTAVTLRCALQQVRQLTSSRQLELLPFYFGFNVHILDRPHGLPELSDTLNIY